MSDDQTICQVASCMRPSDGWFVCRTCAETFTNMLGEVAWLLDELETVMTLQVRYADQGGRTSGSKEQPLPINLKASDVKGELVNEIDTTARIVADLNGWEDEYRRAATASAASVAAWLAHRVAGVRLSPAGGEMVDGFSRWYSAAMWVIDRPPGRRYLGDCSVVDVHGEACPGSVRAKVGDEFARCDTCGTEYDAAARSQWVLDQLDNHLATIAEIATLSTFMGLTLDRERVRKLLHYWVRHKRLLPSKTDGEALYSLLSARALLEVEDAKRRAEVAV